MRNRDNTSPNTTSGCIICSTIRATRLFPPKLRLLSHWNLRDEIKADYGDAADGLAKQRMIAEGDGSHRRRRRSPRAVINNPQLDWNPFTNEVKPTAVKDSDLLPAKESPATSPEPNTRYLRWLEMYRASKLADPYSPNAPTLIARRFDEDRQTPEERVQNMFEQVLASPLVPRVAALIQKRLGRPSRTVRHLVQRIQAQTQVHAG